MLSRHGTVRPGVGDATLAITPSALVTPTVVQRTAIRPMSRCYTGVATEVPSAPAPRVEFRQPRESPESQPQRRQQHVEDEERDGKEARPQSPAPQGHRW